METGRFGLDLEGPRSRPAIRRAEKPPPDSPLVGLAAVFAVGTALAAWLKPPGVVALGALAAALVGLVLWGRSSRRGALVLALVAALAAGMGLHGAARERLETRRARLEAQTAPLELTLLVDGPVDRDDTRQRCFVEIVQAPDELTELESARLSLGLYEADSPWVRPGELIRGSFRLDGVDPPANPLTPDYGAYLSARGIAGWARDVGAVEVVGERAGLDHALLRLRETLTADALEPLNPEARPLARALLLGDRGGLPEEDLELYRRSGVFHIFAVSGLHVGLVGYLFFALGGVLPLRRNGRYLLSLAAIVVFTLLTGARPPALRACLMAGIYLGGRLLGRPAHLGTSVAAAGLILLVINPLRIGDTSFQLSFAAAAGIAALTPELTARLGRLRVPRLLAEPLAAALGAQLALFPLLALHFARVPLLGLLLNLLVVPLLGMILLVGLPYLLLASLWSAAAPLLGEPLGLLLRLLDWLVGRALTGAPLTIDLRQPAWWLVVVTLLLFAAALLIHHRGGRRLRRWVWAPPALLIVLWVVHLSLEDRPEGLRIICFDVDRGDCALIESPAGDRVLIDGGADWTDLAAEYLRRRGVRRLDAVVLSHPDEDHYAGLPSVYADCAVERVYRPARAADTAAWAEYLAAEAYSGAAVLHPSRGVLLPTADPRLELRVVTPADDPRLELGTNDASLALLVVYGSFEMLFTGDLEAPGEAALLEDWDHGAVDLLKLPHHGATDTCGDELLDVLRPGHAVVFPSGGVFDQRTRWRLADHGCWVYDVGLHGAAIIESDGDGFRLGRFDGSFSPGVHMYE